MALVKHASKPDLGYLMTLHLLSANVNAQDAETGDTPLINAADDGRLENIAYLLRAGADVSLRDRRGRSALDRAKEHGDRYAHCWDTLERAEKAGRAPAGTDGENGSN